MKRLHAIVVALIVLLGLIHISFAFPIDKLSEGGLWFIGSGVAIVLAGFINFLTMVAVPTLKTKWVGFLTNLILCCLFIVAIPIIEGPQVYVGISLLG